MKINIKKETPKKALHACGKSYITGSTACKAEVAASVLLHCSSMAMEIATPLNNTIFL